MCAEEKFLSEMYDKIIGLNCEELSVAQVQKDSKFYLELDAPSEVLI